MKGIVVPSRGRPDNLTRLLTRIAVTAIPCSVVVALDADDPELRRNLDVVETAGANVTVTDHGAMAPSLRKGASSFARNVNAGASWLEARWSQGRRGNNLTSITIIGDDHLPQRAGWLERLDEAAGMWGVAYPNDGHQESALPTCVTLGFDLYIALGFVLPPRAMQHLYTDNYWHALGEGLDDLHYLEDVEVTHMHPHAGLAEIDEGYRRAYSAHRKLWDEREWVRYRGEPLAWDILRVQRARRGGHS